MVKSPLVEVCHFQITDLQMAEKISQAPGLLFPLLILFSNKTAFVKDKITLSAKMFIFGGNSRTKPDKSEYKAGWPRARICLVFPFFVMIKA